MTKAYRNVQNYAPASLLVSLAAFGHFLEIHHSQSDSWLTSVGFDIANLVTFLLNLIFGQSWIVTSS